MAFKEFWGISSCFEGIQLIKGIWMDFCFFQNILLDCNGISGIWGISSCLEGIQVTLEDLNGFQGSLGDFKEF